MGKTAYHGLYDQLHCDQPKSNNYPANKIVFIFFFVVALLKNLSILRQAVLNIVTSIHFNQLIYK